jgi:hypothetical protein
MSFSAKFLASICVSSVPLWQILFGAIEHARKSLQL